MPRCRWAPLPAPHSLLSGPHEGATGPSSQGQRHDPLCLWGPVHQCPASHRADVWGWPCPPQRARSCCSGLDPGRGTWPAPLRGDATCPSPRGRGLRFSASGGRTRGSPPSVVQVNDERLVPKLLERLIVVAVHVSCGEKQVGRAECLLQLGAPRAPQSDLQAQRLRKGGLGPPHRVRALGGHPARAGQPADAPMRKSKMVMSMTSRMRWLLSYGGVCFTSSQ